MEENIQLSILDIENKYKFDFEENTYGTNGSRYIVWGSDNQLPLLYNNCYNGSSSLKAIIDGTVNYVLGDDITVNDSAAYWKEQVNRTGMTVRELIENLSFNLLMYNGYAFQVIYNKLNIPVEIYPLDFGRCRVNEDGDKILYSKKWTRYQTKAKEYDIWNPDNINPDNPTQIFYYKRKLGQTIYPLPPYAGAIYDILTEIECSKYSLNTVARGFSAKYVFNFPQTANLTDEQKKGMETAIKNKFCGSENETNFMLYWKNQENDGIDIQKIESDETPERYVAIKDSARENIFISMRCTPLLFGLPNASNGFSTNEYNDSFKLYNKTVVSPIQDIILSSLSKVMGVEKPITITPFTLTFDVKERRPLI